MHFNHSHTSGSPAVWLFSFPAPVSKGRLMSRGDLNRALARATGEYVTTFDGLGFHLVGEAQADGGPLVLDWDAQQAARLEDVVSDDECPGRVDPLPSHDEQFEGEFNEEYACAAA
jgi:hypothetical protein